MFTNINLLRLKITRFINGKKPAKKKPKSKKAGKQANEEKMGIYTVVKAEFNNEMEKYEADEIKDSEFVFSYNDEVKNCFRKITKDFEEVYRTKRKYEQFKSKINLQSLRSKRDFKIKFNENLFKTFEKTLKKLQ